MVDALIRWSLLNRLVVLVAAVLLLAFGIDRIANMPVDVLPDVTAPTVTVIAEASGMAPGDIEQTITLPIESALNGATGVRRVRSATSEGISVINADFDWDIGLLEARQIVSERLQIVATELPAEADPPTIGPMTSVMGDILFVGLTSNGEVSPMELRTLADWTIGRRLLAVPGVAQVVALGGELKQYQVLLMPRRLDAYGLAAEDVARALEDANENMPAGFLWEGGTEQLITGIGRIRSIDDISGTFVAMRDGVPIRVGDVAQVQLGAATKRGMGGVNGEDGVVIGIRKQPNVNTLAITAQVQRVLADVATTLPDGVVLHDELFRQADFIDVAVRNVSAALRDGAILVVLIVLLFLASGRATFITATAIPLSLVVAALVLDRLGVGLNTMTLGGMAIAVGALVDDAIIDVENVARRLRLNAALPQGERQPVFTVVFDASKEVRRSIVFATFIIVLVFVPLFFLPGIEGRLLQPLGAAYTVALLASLVVALTVTPALCSLLLPNSKMVREHVEPRAVRWLKVRYDGALRRVAHHWKLLTAASVALLVAAGVALSFAGRSFLPPFNEGALTIAISTPPGTSLEESERVGRQVEALLLNFPEVRSTARRTGRAENDEHTQPVSSSEVEVRLRPTERSKEAFLAELREQFSGLTGVQLTIGQPIEHRIEHLVSGSTTNIAVKVFGNDLTQMRQVASRIEAEMRQVPGVVDLAIEPITMVPFISVNFNRRALARYGLSIHEVADEIATAFQGRAVTKVYEGSASFDLVVRYDRADVNSFESVLETRIETPIGARVPLHALAKIERSLGPNAIKRESVQRRVVVMANVADRDIGSVVEEIRARIDRNVAMPDGMHVELGGQFENAASTARQLALLGLLVLIGIAVLLTVALRSVRDATLVLVNLPFAVIGGVVGVFLADGAVSIASLIGFITLFGIATRNGIMLVTHIQHLATEEGVRDPIEMVCRGAVERLIPILMTAISAAFGLLPLALALGAPGSEIQAPMAIVILCGLVTSTALNLIVVPALYLRFGKVARTAVENAD